MSIDLRSNLGPYDPQWMQEALYLAKQAQAMDEVPVGAVVVHRGKIVGQGFNQRERLYSPLAHAEIMAIDQASRTLAAWRLSQCILVVTLEPCPMCLSASQQARIARIYYGTSDPKGGALSLGYRLHEDERTHHRFEVISAPNPEASSILSTYFKKKRQKQKN